MNRQLKKNASRLFIFLLMSVMSNAWGACGDTYCSGTTCTATDATYAHVNGAITEGLTCSGDITVNVPSGSESWASTVTFSMASVTASNIYIMGAGTGSTNISGTTDKFSIIGTAGKQFTISGFSFSAASTGDTIHIEGDSINWRIYSNAFSNTVNINIDYTQGITYGLIDNNTFTASLTQRIVYITDSGGVREFSSKIWNLDLPFGTANAIYLENNTITFDGYSSGTGLYDGHAGGRIVWRFNTITNADLGGHDACSTNQRGWGTHEIYENTFIGTEHMYAAMYTRGGVALIWNNTWQLLSLGLSSPLQSNKIFYRDAATCQTPWDDICDSTIYKICSDAAGNIVPVRCTTDENCASYGGYCDTDIDGNEDGTGYPCRDQVGVYKNLLKHPWVGWNNKWCEGASDCSPTTTAEIRSNDGTDLTWVKYERDIVDDYWCTNSADDDSDGNTDNADTECSTYYDDTGTVVDYGNGNTTIKLPGYTPYTYPHPLRGEASTPNITGVTITKKTLIDELMLAIQ